ncbi:MAG: heavy metal translocating P-type ATPase metal-binding domain-containing protein [Bdellovibrionales bacterium]
MQNTANIKTEVQLCNHCGRTFNTGLHQYGVYCCAGCRAVAHLLNQKKLGHFYDLEKSSLLDIPKIETEFLYLDDTNILESLGTSKNRMKFFVAGLDCTACVWLIDQIPHYASSIEKTWTDFGSSIVEIQLSEGAKFSDAAKALSSFGLNPKPILFVGESDKLLEDESKVSLSRIAVAAFCMGNIMLFAISIYAGVDGVLKTVFQWLMLALFLPTATYSAFPIYRNCITALKMGRIHIDLPIAIAILAGFVISFYELLMGRSEIYFVSLAMLIFLLLGSRYLLKTLQQKQNFRFPLLNFIYSVPAKLTDGRVVSALSLQSGDQITLSASDAVPADCKVEAGEGWLHTASLTGESHPQKVGVGDEVFAGTHLVAGNLTARVGKTTKESRVAKLLEAIDNHTISKSSMNSNVDLWAQRFLIGVFLLSLVTVVAFALMGKFEVGLYRALTLMIVTCPCVFAMAIPWTLKLAIQNAADEGVFVKNPELFERLANAKKIIFDKTGTLTQGFLEVKEFQVLIVHPHLRTIAYALERHSEHPVAKSIIRFLDSEVVSEIPQITHIGTIGRGGAQGIVEGQLWTIRPIQEGTTPVIGLFLDQQLMAKFLLEDRLRTDTSQALADLRNFGARFSILSGDQTSVAENVGHELGIVEIHSTQSPEDKLTHIKANPGAVFVGDGNNDAPAMAAANVSIAVAGSLEASLKVSDAYFARPGLQPLVKLYLLSQHAMSVIHTNLVFTAVYNFVGLSLALTGQITALWAALLMPASSLTVTLHSLYRMRRSR